MTDILLAAIFVIALALQAWLASRERMRMLEQMQLLADKVQAPERSSLYTPENPKTHVPLDDDAQFWLAKGEENDRLPS